LYLGLSPKEDKEDQLAKERTKACPFGYLPHKTAKSYQWFLVYVSRTYGVLVSYLKDVEVLLEFTNPEKPPKVPVRPTGAAIAMYMLAMCQDLIFGVSLWVVGEGTIYALHRCLD
jgi:hypothetical protein